MWVCVHKLCCSLPRTLARTEVSLTIPTQLSLFFFCLCLLESGSGLTDPQPNGYERIKPPDFTECLCVRIPLEQGTSILTWVWKLVAGVDHLFGWLAIARRSAQSGHASGSMYVPACTHRVPSSALVHTLQHGAKARGHRLEFGWQVDHNSGSYRPCWHLGGLSQVVCPRGGT